MITVGFDFGTHQTKVCIEDRKDKNRPIYKFMSFNDLNGVEQVVLPSVVQINADDTLSYGFVDKSRCKRDYISSRLPEPTKPNIAEPKLELPNKPKLPVIPNKPKEKVALDWKEKLFEATLKGSSKSPELEKWEQQAAVIENKRKVLLDEWQRKCDAIKATYDEQVRRYNSIMDKFDRDYAEWEKQYQEKKPLYFRYFKQAVFTRLNWQYNITPELLSIWYIANILFDIHANFDTRRMGFQMGIPTGSEDYQRLKEKGTSILLSAFNLVENVFEYDKDLFLSSTYQELIDVTEIIPYSEKTKEDNGLLFFPEAYASLMTLTAKDQLEHGMNLLVDIGGGTTDVSFFVIASKKRSIYPLIYKFFSIPGGINSIVERAKGEGKLDMSRHVSLDSNELDAVLLNKAKQSFNEILDAKCKYLIERLETNFKNTKLDMHKLRDALKHRPIVYTGGGSTFKGMRNGISCFSEIKHMDSLYWNTLNVENINDLQKRGLCPILSVALGLSVSQDDDNITIKPLSTIFEHIKPEIVHDYDKPEYDLLDD